MTEPAPGYTITVTAGTADVLAEIGDHLQHTLAWTQHDVDDHEELAERRRQALEEIHSWVAALHRLLSSNRHDRDVILTPAGPGYAADPGRRSLLFRYTSGLHGAALFWPAATGGPGRWQIHT
jgi:hypothetical protein